MADFITEHVLRITVRTNLVMSNDDWYGLREAIETTAPLGPNGRFEVVNLSVEESRVLEEPTNDQR